MRLYIAGPMRGKPFYNFAAFDRAKAQLENRGHTVVSPADLSREMIRVSYGDTQDETKYELITPLVYMMTDLEALNSCDGIVLLEGWSESKGVAVELAFAVYMNRQIFYTLDLVPCSCSCLCHAGKNYSPHRGRVA